MSKPDVADNFSQKKALSFEDESAHLSSQVSDLMVSKCPNSVGNININVNIGANESIKDLAFQKQLDFGAAQIYPSKNGAEFSATKIQNHDGGQKILSGKFANADGGAKENFNPLNASQFEPEQGWKGMKGANLDDLITLAAEKKAGQLRYEKKQI
ncbi:MAG: hypothetical protein IAF58_02760 [Leptolyngbya sp.]|nr:hypothetical protein [Candidatus Melainabacteria bacterium]